MLESGVVSNAPVVFSSSDSGFLGATRKWLWTGVLFGIGCVLLKGGGFSPVFWWTIGIVLLVAGLFDGLLRVQAKAKNVAVTVHADGIESTSFPGGLLWQDVVGMTVARVGRQPSLQLEVAPHAAPISLGHADTLTRTVVLTSFSIAEQQALCQAVQQRLQRMNPAAPIQNTLQDEWLFRSRFDALLQHPWATYALVAINVGIWVWMTVHGADAFDPSLGDVLRWGGDSAFNVQHGEWWRLFTALFLHIGVAHLATNMACLWVMGPTMERIYGPGVLVLLYLGSGLIGSACSQHFASYSGVSAGASGAVMGLAGAGLVAMFQHRATLPKVFRRQMLLRMACFVLLAMYPAKDVDSAAHLGGLLGGASLTLMLPVRFEPLYSLSKVRGRVALAALWLAGLIVGIVGLAPVAYVDPQSVATVATAFDVVVRAVERDEQRARAGKLSGVELDALRRNVHASAMRQVQAELSQLHLTPGDARTAPLQELKTLVDAMAEMWSMPSVWSPGAKNPEPADPARMAALQDHVKQSKARLAALAEQIRRP